MKKRILAVASGGGHWQQLMEMREAFAGHDVTYVTTIPGLPEEFGATPSRIVPDCNRNKKMAVPQTTAAMARIVWSVRPHVVISTGALPGLIALTLGKGAGARTIWVDSIANAERMSMSGRRARRVADLWLSQWEHVAGAAGADFAGSVL